MQSCHNWEYAPGIRMNFGVFDVKFLWQFLSMYIYIPGIERGSNKKYKESRKLRNAFDMVKEHFHDFFLTVEIAGQSVCEYLSTHFILTRKHFSII
jgi:hypothetical protein